MTIKETTSTTPSSDVSPTDGTTTVVPTATAVTVEEHPQQVITRAVSTQVGQLVVTETPVHSERAPAYISAQGPVDMPIRCQVQREGNQTIIQIRWFGGIVCCLTFFTVVWNGIVVFTMVFLGWFAVLIPHSWVGVFLIYLTACGFLNSTYITITYDNVEVDQRPLKLCRPSKTIQFNKSGHEEMRVKRTVKTTDKGEHITYELHLWDTRTGSFTLLPFRHHQLEVALFLAQEIQKYLTLRTGAAASATAEEVEINC